ncbi:MAG: hypothetical protein CHACPFDD_02393 [Phycisphaerae bacterium]|nr:hypothetical protein [Phycisphaerae bacterium]
MSSFGPSEPEERAAFLAGLAAFNAGDYYDAHDLWEEIWQQLTGRRALFYQALIQTAVVFVQMENQNAAGVRAVYLSARDKLGQLPALYRGVRLDRVLAGLTHAAGWIVERPPGAWRDVAPRADDGMPLLFDRSRAFRIELEYDPFESPRDGDVERR